MAEASIPVDLFNPGQVFACLGFLEAADVLLGDTEGAFDWTDEVNCLFRLRASGEVNPFATVLDFLADAAVCSIVPDGSDLDTDKWNVTTRKLDPDAPFPFSLPSTPATLPVQLEVSCVEGITYLFINHWGEQRQTTSRDNVKFWAGSGGYPGAAVVRDVLDLVRDRCRDALDAPFDLSAEQSSSFRFDWRRDYIPLDLGFSLNSHSKDRFSMVGFPLVELLAAIGLTNARPERFSKLEYRYGVVGTENGIDLLDSCLLRAGLGGPQLPFPQRTFRMNLGWPGKENQARCITTVTEETFDDHSRIK